MDVKKKSIIEIDGVGVVVGKDVFGVPPRKLPPLK
jgi:hypothetical protein